MLFWVNLHPGFVAGLGLLFAYLLLEGLAALFPSRRRAAWQRLRQAWPPLAATVVATLFNPYGPKIFKAALGLAGLQGTDQPGSGPSVLELEAVPLSLSSFAQALEWRNPASSYWWLVLAAVAVIALTLWRRQFGAALLMAATLYVALQHKRYMALFAVVTVVLGSTVLTEAFQSRKPVSGKPAAKPFSLLRSLPVIAVGALCLLTCVRVGDLISSRAYLVSNSTMLFGPGESWWFPERAAAFIQREHLPGNIFQKYNLGGFTAWRLGPAYGDFIDGRNVSLTAWTELKELLASPPDSPVWQTEADRRNIDILFLSLARINGLGSPNLTSLCQSRRWRPVYMDEVSIVLLRNRPENRSWIDKYEVNCQTHNFAPPAQASRRELSNFYANAGVVLMLLGRHDEARETLNRGVAISPDDPSIHLALAKLYEAHPQFGDVEREYKAALSLGASHGSISYDLGRFYVAHGRNAEARPLVLTAAQLSRDPLSAYRLLGKIDLALAQPNQALADFADAEKASVGPQGQEDADPELLAQIAEGRAAAYSALGERQQAIESQQDAVRRTPENAVRWEALGVLYDSADDRRLAEQAHQQAHALSK